MMGRVSLPRTAVAASCALLGACYSPTVHEGAPCGPADVCPATLVCDRGVCVRTPLPDAMPPTDGPPLDAPPDARPLDAYIPLCGSTVVFKDDLSDTTAAPLFTAGADAGMTVTEGGGHVDVTFAASVVANSYGYYDSASNYTAEGLCVALEISQVPANNGLAFFKWQSGTTEVEFALSAGTLTMRTRNPTLVDRKTIAFNATQHRFWRLRQQNGTSYWDTAADGVAYTQQISVNGVFTPMTANVQFGAGAYVDTNNGGNARFESIVAHGP